MPFHCCLNNDKIDQEDIESQKVESKIPKSIDLNEGYYNNIELLIFNNKSDINLKFPKTTHVNLQPVCTPIPITVLETKISGVINAENGHSVAEATSSVIISRGNTPLQLFTKVDIPKESIKNNDPATDNTNNGLNHINNSFERTLDKCEQNLISSNFNNLDSKTNSDESSTLPMIFETQNHNSEISFTTLKEQKSGYLSQNSDISKQITNDTDGIVENKNEHLDMKNIKDEICELIQHSNKPKKNKKKSKNQKIKKTINIEITLSPRNENNVYVDSHGSNINRTKLELSEPHDTKNEPLLISNFCNNFGEKEMHKNNELEIQEIRPDISLTTLNLNDYKNRTDSEATHNLNQDIFQEESSNMFTSKLEKSTESNPIKLDESYSVLSDNFIPFIDDNQCFESGKIYNETDVKHEQNINKSKAINDLTNICDKTSVSLTSSNIDPQFAQLFASAQIHVDEIKREQLNGPENTCFIDKSDPIKTIKDFLEDPHKNKNQICWSTVKAAIDVYKQQIEYAEKKLEMYNNCEKKGNSSIEDNIVYYSDMLEELKEKIELAERAKILIINESNEVEINKMLEVEQNCLEEIKKTMRDLINELKPVEDEYLSGKTENKDTVISYKKKIRKLEDEIKEKLVQIHKLKNLQGLQKKFE